METFREGPLESLIKTNPERACEVIRNLLEAWWPLRGLLGGMRWTIEAGAAIAEMDDRIKDLDPSFHTPPASV